jgi:hypothetical protein
LKVFHGAFFPFPSAIDSLNHLIDVRDSRTAARIRARGVVGLSATAATAGRLQRIQRPRRGPRPSAIRRLKRTIKKRGARIGLIARNHRVQFRILILCTVVGGQVVVVEGVLVLGGGGVGLEGVEGGGLGHGELVWRGWREAVAQPRPELGVRPGQHRRRTHVGTQLSLQLTRFDVSCAS